LRREQLQSREGTSLAAVLVAWSCGRERLIKRDWYTTKVHRHQIPHYLGAARTCRRPSAVFAAFGNTGAGALHTLAQIEQEIAC